MFPSLGLPANLEHNSRTSNDIDMKLGPVTKLNKTNKISLKK